MKDLSTIWADAYGSLQGAIACSLCCSTSDDSVNYLRKASISVAKRVEMELEEYRNGSINQDSDSDTNASRNQNIA